MTADAPVRRRYDADSLLDVAVGIFTERGFDGTSMEQLARAAGLSKSSIYHHVESKDELLRRSLDRALDGLFGVLAATEDGRAIDRLEAVVRGSVRVLVAEQPHVTLLLRVRGNTPVERQALARRRDFDRAVTRLVERAVDEGDLRPDADPALSSRLVFGMVNSITEWHRPGRSLTPERLADAVVGLVLEGLRTR
ncbi:MAG TPA: TetR/AcrR family transcriptional regulator [Nocardioides sp.]|jgi:AcrR family transcriptional regulator